MVAMGNLKEWIDNTAGLEHIAFTGTRIFYITLDTLHARSSTVTKLYTISHTDF